MSDEKDLNDFISARKKETDQKIMEWARNAMYYGTSYMRMDYTDKGLEITVVALEDILEAHGKG